MHRISVKGCKNYAPQTVREAVRAHFTALNLDRKIKPGMKILIKPNLLMRCTPGEARSTHPALVEAVAEECIARGARVLLAESPGGPYVRTQLKAIYASTGMEAAAKAAGFELNDDLGYQTRQYPDSQICKEFEIINPILSCDYIINICKLKTHGMTGYTGAVKNMFGAVPGLIKPELHFRFPELSDFSNMLIDLCLATKPDLSFIDAVYGMEGDGPSGGTPRYLGVTLSAENPFALDLAACRLIGFSPDEVSTVKASIERELISGNMDHLSFLGDSLETFSVDDFKRSRAKSSDFKMRLPAFLRGITELAAAPRPHVMKAQCIGCGKCAESCPPKVISIRHKKAKINRESCIKCFCCQEMCPVKAISIKRPFFLQW